MISYKSVESGMAWKLAVKSPVDGSATPFSC
eukprot:COSAG01_NODE_11800_length_1857_cov_1.124005_1_plen_30_part_10